MTVNSKADTCYQLINNKATSNAFLQGATGVVGLLVTTAVDVYALKIYADMWNDIRKVYNQSEVNIDDAINVIKNILTEVVSDIALDKILGNIPLVGVYFNAICAKQMTWRLGTLFTMLASRGADINNTKCKETIIMIRHMFPQSDMFMFVTPDYNKFIQLVDGVSNCSVQSFNKKIDDALAVFGQN